MTRHSEIDDNKALFALWRGWTVTYGSVTAVAVCSIWMSRVWLPALAFFLSMMIYVIVRRNRDANLPLCYAVPYLGTWILIATGAILTCIDIWQTTWLFPSHAPDNPSMPYIGALVVFPVTALFMLWGVCASTRLPICLDCQRRFGTQAERGFIAGIYENESMFQRRTTLWIASCLSIAGWIYYFAAYVNISFNRTDTYVFIIVPALTFLIATLYMGVRYLSIWYYYNRDIEGTELRNGRSTTLRYIVISGNEILLSVPDQQSEMVIGDEKPDTPAKLTLPYSRTIDLPSARYYFMNMFGLKGTSGVEVRSMYDSVSATGSNNTFHYLVFLDDREAIARSGIAGEWVSIMTIKSMLDDGRLASLFGAEITRLVTIAMAWKTYDRDGHRLYRIKHYVPTFRVCDIHKWDIDYNDPHWLYIASNNEDRHFFKLRKLWRRYVSGIRD